MRLSQRSFFKTLYEKYYNYLLSQSIKYKAFYQQKVSRNAMLHDPQATGWFREKYFLMFIEILPLIFLRTVHTNYSKFQVQLVNRSHLTERKKILSYYSDQQVPYEHLSHLLQKLMKLIINSFPKVVVLKYSTKGEKASSFCEALYLYIQPSVNKNSVKMQCLNKFLQILIILSVRPSKVSCFKAFRERPEP